MKLEYLAFLGVGVVIGIFIAPKKGSETANDIKEKINETKEDIMSEISDIKQNLSDDIIDIEESFEMKPKEKKKRSKHRKLRKNN